MFVTLRRFFQACGFAILLLLQPVHASAQIKSFVMNTPDAIMAGNTLLPPGSYLWRLVDSPSNRNIVQVQNRKTGRVETTILAYPAFRRVATDRNELTFYETPTGSPRAVRDWFYPGDLYGQELPFPEQLRSVIAAVQPPVVCTPLLSKQSARHIPLATGEPPKTASSLQKSVTPADQDQGSWAIISGSPSGKTDPAASTRRPHASLWDRVKSLPLTATLAPLVGLLGLAAFGLYFLTRKKRKQPLAV